MADRDSQLQHYTTVEVFGDNPVCIEAYNMLELFEAIREAQQIVAKHGGSIEVTYTYIDACV